MNINFLSSKQVLKFHTEGWLGPFQMMSQSKMSIIRDKIFSQIINPANMSNLDPESYLHNRHLDKKIIWRLCIHKELVKRAICLLGKDLLCFRTNLQYKKSETNFIKGQGEYGEVPWHQDSAYYNFIPNLALTAWIAITDTNKKNGCLRIIPFTHKKEIPHSLNYKAKAFEKTADKKFFDEKKSIDVPLKAGQFIFFNENMLHSSYKNMSSKPRLGFSPRMTTTNVFFPEWKKEKVVILSGKDHFNRYQVVKTSKYLN